MEGDFITINEKLLPLSWLYGLGVGIRNTLFEMGVLKSRSFKTPVISVGNITVGGTGKTPHVEYLIRLLRNRMNVAVLSRGYKRKSRGYIVSDSNTPIYMIGDEPWQMKHKFPDVTVAVDKKRTRGITNLTQNGGDGPVIDVILLDDAFQHRYVKPGVNILLVDYHRLVIYDKLLPAGRLREPVNAKDRADIVIVTKCPKDLKPMDFRVVTKAMNLYPYQQLYFSTLEYDSPKAVFEDVAGKDGADNLDSLESLAGKNILLLTGIASPEQMVHDLQEYNAEITPLTFGDHHHFKRKDVELINDAFARLPEPRIILTTEKDSTRLIVTKGLSDEVKARLYMLPMRIAIMQGQEEKFNNKILDYVYKNTRNSVMAQRKDDHESPDGDHTGNRPRTISFRNN
ncbi:MAG: tetraacyldisaccharide 4'-kinase [Prevotella sp.]|nr:tetraacyldisaccharide 4'-kinase [Prevotella sp.]